MAGASAYAAKAMLDWLLGGAGVTQPSSRFVGLAVGAPTSISASEVSAGGYVRHSLVCPPATSPAGSAWNSTAFSWAAFGTAATVIGIHIWDTNVGGHMLAYGNLAASSVLAATDTVSIAASALKITLV